MAGSISDNEDMISGINVTPLVDIMLVLLIIFMVTASYIVNRAIEVKLPEAETATQTRVEDQPLNIVLDKAGQLYLNGDALKLDELPARIDAERSKKPGANLYALISADAKIPYESVVRVIDLIRKNNITEFAINVDPPTE